MYSDNNNIKTEMMATEFKIIGFTDKVNECDCCNRNNMKKQKHQIAFIAIVAIYFLLQNLR